MPDTPTNISETSEALERMLTEERNRERARIVAIIEDMEDDPGMSEVVPRVLRAIEGAQTNA